MATRLSPQPVAAKRARPVRGVNNRKGTAGSDTKNVYWWRSPRRRGRGDSGRSPITRRRFSLLLIALSNGALAGRRRELREPRGHRGDEAEPGAGAGMVE